MINDEENTGSNPLLNKEIKTFKNIRYIGNIKCLFLKCYKNGEYPLFNIGKFGNGCLFMVFFAIGMITFLTLILYWFC